MTYKLYPHQVAAVERIRQEIRNGHKRVAVSSPTGSGKTIIGCHILSEATKRGSKTLFLCHRIEIIGQTSAKLNEIGIHHGIIKAGVKPTDSPVQIASVQTLARRKLPPANIVIVDENHHVVAGSWRRIIDGYPDAIVIGLSATQFRADGRGLGEAFQAIVMVSQTAELIKMGYLVQPITYAPATPDLTGVRTVMGDYNQTQLAQRVNRPKLVGDIITTWKRLAAGRTTVCFATNVEHSKEITARFVAAGVAAEHVDADSLDRAEILSRLASGETTVVVNVNILSEGYNLQKCSCVILARPTQSKSLYIQQCGRALRTCDGKTDCVILDHAGNTQLHGLVTDPLEVTLDGIKKRDLEKAPSIRVCLTCYAANPSGTPACIQCACAFAPIERAAITETSGELAQVKGPLIPVASEELKRERYKLLLAQATQRNYKPGWASFKFKSMFGHWPQYRNV